MDQPLSSLEAVFFTTPEPDALADFYQHGFGLQPPTRQGDDQIGLELANTYLGFDRAADAPAGGGIVIWVRVTDIMATFERLVQLGATVTYAPTSERSADEVYAMLKDPAGNAIGLLSPA